MYLTRVLTEEGLDVFWVISITLMLTLWAHRAMSVRTEYCSCLITAEGFNMVSSGHINRKH